MNKRRRFLLGGVAATGALIVGWGLMPPRQRLHASRALPLVDKAVALNGWVAIGPDGMVSITMARSEMGQGVHTALPMLLAEELDVALERTRLMQAPVDPIYGNQALMRDSLHFHPDTKGNFKDGVQWVLGKMARELGIMFTGGSSSIKDAWTPMREAGAIARAMLVAAAAREWKVDAGACTTADGVVSHGEKKLTYGELASKAAGVEIDAGAIRLKDPKAFKLIGQRVARRDSPAKVNGIARFGIDARPEGMLYAAVKMAPVLGAKPVKFDAAGIKDMPGVVKAVDCSAGLVGQTGAGAGVAVIAKTYWQARKAVDALQVTWSESEHAKFSSEGLMAEYARTLDEDSGFTYSSSGDASIATAKQVKAEYRAPFLAHATMEPVNCTAQVKDGRVQLWVSTQVPSIAVDIAAKVANVSGKNVDIEVLLLGGGFGRRLEADMVGQAVAIAMQAGGLPVQLVWSREDDTRHDVYRPAALARLSGGLDANGNIVSFESRSISASIGHQYYPRALGLPGMGPDKTAPEGLYDMQYEIPNQRIGHVIADGPVPVGYWRSVGHSHNAFFKESFIDELAHAAGKDPVAVRRSLMANHPRHLAALEAAVAKAGAAPEGRAHGFALHQSFGSIVATVAEVSVVEQRINVHRVVCAVDCGLVINPNIVEQQVESSVVFGLSAALTGEITFRDGRVQQSNFGDYPVLRMNEAPVVETVILPSAEHPEGIGEPAVPTIAPAVSAAVFKLTGQRLRSLPLRLARSVLTGT
jgi:isoquinoline 1-oxidoreductase beta subunit